MLFFFLFLFFLVAFYPFINTISFGTVALVKKHLSQSPVMSLRFRGNVVFVGSCNLIEYWNIATDEVIQPCTSFRDGLKDEKDLSEDLVIW